MANIENLQRVSAAVKQADAAWVRYKAIAEEQVAEKMRDHWAEVDRLVMVALDGGDTVTDVARAYTTSGRTPNRNAIHEIKKRSLGLGDETPEEYPFAWVPRRVTTVRGEKTVYDIHAVDMVEFGPDGITGDYTWRYDPAHEEPEPILTEADPYPTTRYYKQALRRWVLNNPLPEEE